MKKIETEYELLVTIMEYEVSGRWWTYIPFGKKLRDIISKYLYHKTIKKFKRYQSYKQRIEEREHMKQLIKFLTS